MVLSIVDQLAIAATLGLKYSSKHRVLYMQTGATGTAVTKPAFLEAATRRPC
jgi:hypothetical protein